MLILYMVYRYIVRLVYIIWSRACYWCSTVQFALSKVETTCTFHFPNCTAFDDF